ncbi:MAG: inositol monophosphatase [Gammaproteobacteria bacterium]
MIKKSIIDAIKDIAHQELCPRFAKVIRNQKQDGSFLTEADLAVQNQVQDLLQKHYPDIAFLGEEMTPTQQQALLENHEGVWVLDPLDGTSNFSAGIPYYSVSLALIREGKAQWGMVYDPERDECFTASSGEGAFLNNQPILRKEVGVTIDKSTALIDFKRLDKDLAARIASKPPYSSQRSFGGVALDWCWLATGRVHIYLHGRQNIWDYAAGHLVFNEVGGYSCTLQGETIFDFSLKPRSAVAAQDKQLFTDWTSFLEIRGT